MGTTVIITHGLGKHPPNFWKPLAKKIKKKCNVTIVPFYYHDIFQATQESKFKLYENLNNKTIRKFVFENIGDAVTYRQPEIYKQITDKLTALLTSLEGQKIVIIAPSLGGQIIMDYIWDGQKGKHAEANIDIFITNGCNIPVFVSGLSKIEHIKQDFLWLNYYDFADVLGFPLRPLDYEAKDIRIKTRFSLFSHLRYWHNNKFIKSITEAINLITY